METPSGFRYHPYEDVKCDDEDAKKCNDTEGDKYTEIRCID